MITQIGQRVQPRYAPEHKGTVVALSATQFTVQYDWPQDRPARKRGERRERYTYLRRQEDNFVPESFEEIRLLEDDGLDLPIEIPEEIMRIYGDQLRDG